MGVSSYPLSVLFGFLTSGFLDLGIITEQRQDPEVRDSKRLEGTEAVLSIQGEERIAWLKICVNE